MKVKIFLASLFVALCSMSFSAQAQSEISIINKTYTNGNCPPYATSFYGQVYSPVKATIQIVLMTGYATEAYPLTYYFSGASYHTIKHTSSMGGTFEWQLNPGYNTLRIERVINYMTPPYGQILLEKVISGNVFIDKSDYTKNTYMMNTYGY